MSIAHTKIALYASYQTGEDLPGYVRYALQKLAATDFHVVLLTNQRPLSEATGEFLAENDIELFLTENHGYDFGMWRRYLKLQANSAASFSHVERLLLVNDSIVYYKNIFPEIFAQAEKSEADVVSLTKNDEVAPHLQSYFMYMKQPALGAFYMHLLETPEQDSFYEVVHKLEIGLGNEFRAAEVTTAALYETEKKALFASDELIRQGAGFIKRKLLQRRFSFDEKVHFIRQGEMESLNADYVELIKSAGMDPDFDAEWLPGNSESFVRRAVDKLWEKPFQKVGWPLLRTAITAKYKILGRKLEGNEFR